MLLLLARLSWPELRHHPWRNVAALVAVMLGVALAFSVHLINASALAEFGSAVRNIDGEPDLQLIGNANGFDESLHARLAAQPEVDAASPIVEGEAVVEGAAGAGSALHVVGRDVLAGGSRSRALLPQPRPGEGRFAALDPEAVFLNAAAERLLGSPLPNSLVLRSEAGRQTFHVAGGVAAPGRNSAGDRRVRRVERMQRLE